MRLQKSETNQEFSGYDRAAQILISNTVVTTEECINDHQINMKKKKEGEASWISYVEEDYKCRHIVLHWSFII